MLIANVPKRNKLNIHFSYSFIDLFVDAMFSYQFIDFLEEASCFHNDFHYLYDVCRFCGGVTFK